MIIWKGGKPKTVNVGQVRIYHPRESHEDVVETDGVNGEESRAEQVETEGSKGLAREESTKAAQCPASCKSNSDCENGGTCGKDQVCECKEGSSG
ncbi:hypothetical protein NPIL_60131, partial [Nephila pilipes]